MNNLVIYSFLKYSKFEFEFSALNLYHQKVAPTLNIGIQIFPMVSLFKLHKLFAEAHEQYIFQVSPTF